MSPNGPLTLTVPSNVIPQVHACAASGADLEIGVPGATATLVSPVRGVTASTEPRTAESGYRLGA